MHKFSGRLNDVGETGSASRIVALGAHGAVLSEVHADEGGAWALASPEPPEWIIAALSGRRIAAAHTRADSLQDLRLPSLVTLQFDFLGEPSGAVLWIDPVDLEGFPADLLGALRTHPGNIIDLHLGEIPAASSQLFQAQRGRYRISGGRVAIHPGQPPGSGGLVLDRLVDARTGAALAALNGELFLDVQGPARYRVLFAPSV